MAKRSDLHALFTAITPNVYFDPPISLIMEYPCIRYTREVFDNKQANNRAYSTRKRYQVTVMDRNSDSIISEQVNALPYCRSDRYYASDDLHHDVFTIFF